MLDAVVHHHGGDAPVRGDIDPGSQHGAALPIVSRKKGVGEPQVLKLHRVRRAVGDTDTSLAFAAVTVFSVFGVLLWRAAEWVERAVLPWHPSQRETLLLRDATT